MSKKNRIINISDPKQSNKILKEVGKRVKRLELIEKACRDMCLNYGIDPEKPYLQTSTRIFKLSNTCLFYS